MTNNINDNYSEYEQDVPIFFSVGDKFVSICSVALMSMMENSNPKVHYSIYILNSGMNEVNQQKLKSILFPNFSVEFFDVTETFEKLNIELPIRDYYNAYTYYRLFIPSFFPKLEKAIYIDSDVIVLGDIAELYNTDIQDNLVAAVPDGVMQNYKVFEKYAEIALGIHHTRYFNAGVLLMNLKEMRKFDFENKFVELCGQYKFRVAQDQDYLNVLCKDRVKYLPYDWDMMPIPNSTCKYDTLKIIHYNLMFKPWDMKNVNFEEYFWKYAEKSPYYLEIKEMRSKAVLDAEQGNEQLFVGMYKLSYEDMDDKNNYNRTHDSVFLDD